MFISGIHTGGCGHKSIRFRPTLTLQKHHVEIFLDRFNLVLAAMSVG
jgi:4-aminobutyrate aminotransferase-like enzyme